MDSQPAHERHVRTNEEEEEKEGGESKATTEEEKDERKAMALTASIAVSISTEISLYMGRIACTDQTENFSHHPLSLSLFCSLEKTYNDLCMALIISLNFSPPIFFVSFTSLPLSLDAPAKPLAY